MEEENEKEVLYRDMVDEEFDYYDEDDYRSYVRAIYNEGRL